MHINFQKKVLLSYCNLLLLKCMNFFWLIKSYNMCDYNFSISSKLRPVIFAIIGVSISSFFIFSAVLIFSSNLPCSLPFCIPCSLPFCIPCSLLFCIPIFSLSFLVVRILLGIFLSLLQYLLVISFFLSPFLVYRL